MEKINIRKNKVTTHNLKKVIPYYKKSKKNLIFLLIMFFISGIFGIFAPIFSANALASLALENFAETKKFAVLMCIFSIAKLICNYIVEMLHTRINTKTKSIITKQVIESISKTKMEKLDELKLGSLTERLSSDIKTISDTYIDMMTLIFDIITNVVFLIYIAYLNIWLFLILLVYVVILYGICVIKSRVWIRGIKLNKKAMDDAKSACYEQISGLRDIKLLNINKNVSKYSYQKFDKAIELEVKVSDKRNLIRRIQKLFSHSFEIFFLLIGIYFIQNQFIFLAGFLVIYNYYGKVDRLVSYISSFKEFKADGEVSASRVFEIIDDYEKEVFGTETLENFSGKIEISDLSFSYSKSKNTVLKNLEMDFLPNKMTAIVGKSGSGKTTILNLISKLYDADGKILFDGKDIKTLSENTIRSNIGEVSQSPYIFNTSIRQNLLFSKPDATEEELISVLKQTQIYDDIMKMPNGIDTEIGDNGIKISGGQKQRLAIARLILRNTKVIVFDEATSALDNDSQRKIVELLETLKKDKTIIIVAHRLSTIVSADKIYVLDNGKIKDSGTHRWLMRRCAIYKDLYKNEESSSKINK